MPGCCKQFSFSKNTVLTHVPVYRSFRRGPFSPLLRLQSPSQCFFETGKKSLVSHPPGPIPFLPPWRWSERHRHSDCRSSACPENKKVNNSTFALDK
jgi:hypothetical protein